MRFHLAPAPLLHLITTILLIPQRTSANPAPPISVQAGFEFNELLKRYDCSGELCGWNDQLCCPNGGCYTNALQQATCTGGGSYSASAAPAPSAAGGGYWQVYTTVYTVTDKEVITSVVSNYVGGSVSAVASSTPSGQAHCNFAINESPCGDICCSATQYCFNWGICKAAAGSETTTTVKAGGTAGAPIRPTSSGVVVVTATESPTTTVPFQTPVATGANVTMTATESGGGGGLSGGAIAGIVIGVLVGLLLLGLICFYCCIKGLLDGCLALFGLGGKKKRRTEVDTYERHSHHTHSGGGGGRTWYGASKPARPKRKEESHKGRKVAGGLAGLAGLWAVLGLKRKRNDRKNNGSEYSYSSDYYTSSSE
ncbi:uncharacterized protein LTR77_006563 [Saxophila tyrrhenica]|uniref:Uncharacterized protein n=1 Tax=Saxophila tyrrhenica TaxID=1690608 RepID=A0AAV9P987_9PEZI|nr:hypothetical protein LTR77_006563 [Saxophila tyrrhenica]